MDFGTPSNANHSIQGSYLSGGEPYTRGDRPIPANGNAMPSARGLVPGRVSRVPTPGPVEQEEEAEKACTEVRSALGNRQLVDLQTGKLGVDFALHLNRLRNQDQAGGMARQVAGRNCLRVNGVWIDDGCKAGMKTVAVKAQSAAYFRILERHPEVKEAFQLGNRVVWVTPSGVALVIDAASGKEALTDTEIDRLFVAKK